MKWALALAAACTMGCGASGGASRGAASPVRCPSSGVQLQVLGSGGPIPDDDRASAGYLVWVEGRARLLVDAGGGVFQRFGAAGASLETLDAIAITHVHADHSADLAALLKGGYFAERKRPLPIIGPTGNDSFPAMDDFLRALLDDQRGAYRYLSPYLDGAAGWFRTPVTLAQHDSSEPERVLSSDGLELRAVGVKHGRVPALGYLVEVGGARIGFGGDQGQGNDDFQRMVRGVDLLVMHHAVPEGARGLRHLHAAPSQIGALAAASGARQLVLSHHMQRALNDLDGSLARIEAAYDGPVRVANDLDCFAP